MKHLPAFSPKKPLRPRKNSAAEGQQKKEIKSRKQIVRSEPFFGNKKSCKDRNLPYAKQSLICVILLLFGALADIILYYVRSSSSGMIFTVAVFLLYIVILFTNNLLTINRKSYTDMQTGLFNKTRWNELMKTKDSPVGVMLLDLNRLKTINDTRGHETGDRLIPDFAELLRRAEP